MKKVIAIILGIFLTLSLFAEARNALLIANGDYENATKLSNPVKEVRELRTVLQKLDFSVTILENGSREQMEDYLFDFQTKLERNGGIGFFLYSGHGVQVNGKNYLIPVDANVPDERRVATRTIDLDEVMGSMQAETNIVIIDACRTNPFKYSSGKNLTKGLALTDTKPKNSIIVYSAQPNKTAWDGVFTPTLTAKLLEQKELGTLLREVRKEVFDKTNGDQSPGEYNELMTEVYLAGKIAQSNATVQQNMTTNTEYIKLGKEAFGRKEYNLAFEYFMKAGHITDSSAQCYLGYMYDKGYGVTQNYAKAIEWYEMSAAQGNASAQNNLGYMYDMGYGVTQDYAKAVEWYEKSALQGIASAQNSLGYMYTMGYGVTQDYAKAVEWYEKSALQGNASAQNNLGWMYQNGLGVTQNYAKAVEWYEKSALQGNATVQYNLGYMYEKGHGVTLDYAKAVEWYEKAAAQGDEDAINAIKRLDAYKITSSNTASNQNVTISIIDHKWASLGRTTLPEWIDAYIDNGIRGVEKLADFAEEYCFVAEYQPTNLDVGLSWLGGFEVPQVIASQLQSRIEALFIGAAIGEPEVYYGKYFDNIIKTTADITFQGAKKVSDYWVLVRTNDLVKNTYEDVYKIYVLYTIPKSMFDKQLKNEIDDAMKNPNITKYQQTAFNNVKKILENNSF